MSCQSGTVNTGANSNVTKTFICEPAKTANALIIKSIQKSRFLHRRYATSPMMTPTAAKG